MTSLALRLMPFSLTMDPKVLVQWTSGLWSVREFGTIYEGLLESQLSLAEEDLALNRKGVYVPVGSAGRGAETAIFAGEVYLHGKSGARKETGSYFTKPFVVETPVGQSPQAGPGRTHRHPCEASQGGGRVSTGQKVF